MIRCIKFRRHERNTLHGFVSLELTRVGIIIHDCTWHRHADGKEWVGFLARSYTDTGETLWSPTVEFAPGAKDTREQFRRAALEAIHAVAGELGLAQ